jgi:TetR/AcrR family transcriptional regulator, transcriptional repressor for nem operon
MPPTRERLLEVAARLFWEKGYQATSVADILRESQTNSGSLYHFFATKQDLLLGVLDRYRDGIEPMLLEPVWAGIEDPLERIHALLGGYRQLLIDSEFRLGCPIGNIALEIAEPDPALRERLIANFEKWSAAVERCLEEAGHRIRAGVDRRGVAQFALVTMEGGVMLARTFQSIEAFDAAHACFRDYLAELTVNGSAPGQGVVPSPNTIAGK